MKCRLGEAICPNTVTDDKLFYEQTATSNVSIKRFGENVYAFRTTLPAMYVVSIKRFVWNTRMKVPSELLIGQPMHAL